MNSVPEPDDVKLPSAEAPEAIAPSATPAGVPPEEIAVPIEHTDRRDFFKKALAVICGAIATVIPAAAGLAVFFDPVRRKSPGGAGEFVRVTTLSAVPTDGVPRKFPIIADRVDAWNKFPQVPIGAVYLRRDNANKIEALNVVCPHAGGFVDYSSENKCFLCPLHNSKFALDGKIADQKSPSPRAMDTLEVQVRNEEIWVKFQNFRSGPAEKIPAA